MNDIGRLVEGKEGEYRRYFIKEGKEIQGKNLGEAEGTERQAKANEGKENLNPSYFALRQGGGK